MPLDLERRRATAHAYYRKNRDRIKRRIRAWQKANPERLRQYGKKNTLRQYGLTPEQFKQLLQDQGGVCLICGTGSPGGRGTWHVDHSHNINTVRGLLCQPCNMGLGLFQDSPIRLRAAADYLERHQ